MSTKKKSPSNFNTDAVDYEERQHVVRKKKEGILSRFSSKNKTARADEYGFDDADEIKDYERYIK